MGILGRSGEWVRVSGHVVSGTVGDVREDDEGDGSGSEGR